MGSAKRLVSDTIFNSLVSRVIAEVETDLLPEITERRRQMKERYGVYARTPEEQEQYQKEHPERAGAMTFGELNMKMAAMGMPTMGVNVAPGGPPQVSPVMLECVLLADLKRVGEITTQVVFSANIKLGLVDNQLADLRYQVYDEAVRIMFPATWANDKEGSDAFKSKARTWQYLTITIMALEYLLAAYKFFVQCLYNTPFLLFTVPTITVVGMLYMRNELRKSRIKDPVHEITYESAGALAPYLAAIIINGFVLLTGLFLGWT